MASRLFDAKPLPEPMLIYRQLEKNIEIWIETQNFPFHENLLKNAVCESAAILSRGVKR